MKDSKNYGMLQGKAEKGILEEGFGLEGKENYINQRGDGKLVEQRRGRGGRSRGSSGKTNTFRNKIPIEKVKKGMAAEEMAVHQIGGGGISVCTLTWGDKEAGQQTGGENTGELSGSLRSSTGYGRQITH